MAPTKADPLHNRMLHAFGREEMERVLLDMVRHSGVERDILELLTDEARDTLLRRCIMLHKQRRKYAAENRRHYRERTA